VIESANYKLFRSLHNPQHCLHTLLPPTKPRSHDLRPKGHNYQIPNYSTELHKRSFIPHSLFQYYWVLTSSIIILFFKIIFVCFCMCFFCVLSMLLYCSQLFVSFTACVYVWYMFIKRDLIWFWIAIPPAGGNNFKTARVRYFNISSRNFTQSQTADMSHWERWICRTGKWRTKKFQGVEIARLENDVLEVHGQ